MKELFIFFCILSVFLTIASVHDGRRISALEKVASQLLQTCKHSVAVMAADGKSSVSVCQP